MRFKFKVIVVLMLSGICLQAQTIDGFKGHKWGTAYDSLRSRFSLEDVVEEMRDLVVYRSSIKTLGGVQLKGCSFVFYKGLFAGVIIHTTDYATSRALLRLWTEAYGEGYKPNDYIEEYYWEQIGADSYAVYDETLVTNEASLIYGCLSLMQKREQDERDAAERGKSDL